MEKFTFKPNNIHFILMRRIYKYLWGTVHWELPYHIGAIANILEVYLDVDFKGDPYIESQETVIGFVLQMNGGWISWGSWNQSNIARKHVNSSCKRKQWNIGQWIWIKIWEQMDLIYCEHHRPLETRTLLWTPWDIYLNKNLQQHKRQHLRGTKALVQPWLHGSGSLP